MASRSSAAAHGVQTPTPWWAKWTLLLIGLLLCSFVVFPISLLWRNGYHPSFEVKSISIFTNKLDPISNYSQVDWNLEISIINRNPDSSFSFRVLDVWIPKGLKATVLNAVPFDTHPRNTGVVNASAKAYYPSGMIQELMSGFNITLQAEFDEGRSYRGEAVCKDLTVSLSPNAERGSMVGGPKPCGSDRFYFIR